MIQTFENGPQCFTYMKNCQYFLAFALICIDVVFFFLVSSAGCWVQHMLSMLCAACLALFSCFVLKDVDRGRRRSAHRHLSRAGEATLYPRGLHSPSSSLFCVYFSKSKNQKLAVFLTMSHSSRRHASLQTVFSTP